jgi:hypothetical protein
MKAQAKKRFSFELLTAVHWFGQDVIQYMVYASEFEAMLEKGREELEEKVEARMVGIAKDVQIELAEDYAWELDQSTSFFPQLHRESLFLTLYNYLEHSLNTVCERIGVEIESNVKLREIDGRGVRRAISYLKSVPQFNFSEIGDDIAFIRNANALRNSVVHNGSILPEQEKHPANIFVNVESTLSGEPGKPVSFEAEFLPLFGTKIRSLFEEIGNEMQRCMKDHR